MEFRKAARLAVTQAITADTITTLDEIAGATVAMAYPTVTDDDILQGLFIAAKTLVRTAIRMAPKVQVGEMVLLPLIAVKIGHDDYRYVPAKSMRKPEFVQALSERDQNLDNVTAARSTIAAATAARTRRNRKAVESVAS